LLGDLVTLQWHHVFSIYGYSVGLIAIIWYFWRSLTSWIIDEDLAKVEGHPVELLRYGLMTAIALFIALSMQFVGVLLITALLITPAASARLLAKSPEHMALLSILYAVFSTILGTLAAGLFDWPLGPSIVFTSSIGFGITLFLHQLCAINRN
jgi:zinc transport system permease protein